MFLNVLVLIKSIYFINRVLADQGALSSFFIKSWAHNKLLLHSLMEGRNKLVMNIFLHQNTIGTYACLFK